MGINTTLGRGGFKTNSSFPQQKFKESRVQKYKQKA